MVVTVLHKNVGSGRITGTLSLDSKLLPLASKKGNLQVIVRWSTRFQRRVQQMKSLQKPTARSLALPNCQPSCHLNLRMSFCSRRLEVYIFSKNYLLKGVFVDGLPWYIPHSMQACWSRNKTTPLQNLAYHSKSLTIRQAASRPVEEPDLYSTNRQNSSTHQSCCQ